MEKYVMSLCHIWFGVDRSNRLGGGFGFFRAFGCGVASPVCFRCRRTVSGLAFRKNRRRRICEIRLTPCRGSSFFNSVIFSFTGVGSFDGADRRRASCKPASPYWR